MREAQRTGNLYLGLDSWHAQIGQVRLLRR